MGDNANLGYLFQRGYYKDITAEIWCDKDRQKNFFWGKNNAVIRQSKQNVESVDVFNDKRVTKIELQTVYPGLVTGIGMAHQTGMQGECKLGMVFDYTSGLPLIPGPSVKGLIRSMFPILSTNKPVDKADEKTKKLIGEKREYIKELWGKWKEKADEKKLVTQPDLNDDDIDELAEVIFNGRKKDVYLPMYERDVFFDAEIDGNYSTKGILDVDFITPHKNEFQDPNPIKFLKVLPEVKFVFRFRLNDSELSSGAIISVDTKKFLFEEILKTVGIGAKTNVGYGQLKEPDKKPTQNVGRASLCSENFDNHINQVSETVPIATPQIKPQTTSLTEVEYTGKLILIKGVGYKVRLEDSKYGNNTYDLSFKQDSDKKKLNKKSERVKVSVTINNNKVKRVTFISSI